MDPDGLTLLILIISFVLAVIFAFQAGAFTAEEENETESRLGFSNEVAGVFACFVLLCGFIVYWVCANFMHIGLWLIAGGAFAVALFTLAFALGFCRGKVLPAVKIICVALGAVITAATHIIFKAADITCDVAVTEEEVLSLVDDVEEQDLIDENQKEMITNIFELDDVTASEIMTHRTELVSAEEKTPVGDVIRLVLEHGFSRMPVYRKTLDNVVGIVYAKDLLSLINTHDTLTEPISQYVRSAMFVPEGRKARELLVDFKHKRTQIAIVVDEYGGTAGIVSMEDILEEIVGNIQDEYDNEDELLVPHEDGFIADGSLDLEDVFDAFDICLPEAPETEFDSVGGLITETLGRIPLAGENINVTYCGIKFKVLEVGERRIVKVKCTKAEPETQNEEDTGDA